MEIKIVLSFPFFGAVFNAEGEVQEARFVVSWNNTLLRIQGICAKAIVCEKRSKLLC